jgi:hypothetical protein
MGSCVCSRRNIDSSKRPVVEKNTILTNIRPNNNNTSDNIIINDNNSNNGSSYKINELNPTTNLIPKIKSIENIIKFFPLESLPIETVNLLNGKINIIESDCKNEIKIYVSATFTGIYQIYSFSTIFVNFVL